MPSWRNRKSSVNMSQRSTRITDARASAKEVLQRSNQTSLSCYTRYSKRGIKSQVYTMIGLSGSKGGHTQNFWTALIKKYPLILLLVAAFPTKYLSSNFVLHVQLVEHFWNTLFVIAYFGRSPNAPEFERHLKNHSWDFILVKKNKS
jgi:hypothetical protein